MNKKAIHSSSKSIRPTYTDIDGEVANDDHPASEPEDEHRCFCGKPDFGSMLGCENEQCKIEWFHPKCLGIVKMPEKDEAWICPDCREGEKMKEEIRKLEEGKGTINGMLKVNLDGVKICEGQRQADQMVG